MANQAVGNGSDAVIFKEEAGPDLVQLQADLEACRKKVNHDPRNVKLLNALGLAAEAVGDYDRARWAYKRAVRLDPSYGPAYRNLGLMLQRQGHVKQAILALEKSLKYPSLDTNENEILNALEQLWLHVEETESEAAQVLDNMLNPKEKIQPADILEHEKEVEAKQSASRPLAQLELTPAEALLLLDPDGSDARQMLRYTALDLINKQILEVNKRGQISRGPKFNQANLEKHENFLANYFNRFDLGIDLTQYTNVIFNRLGKRYNAYKTDLVRRVLLDKGYLAIETSYWLGFIPVRHYALTDEGKRVLHELQRQLTQAASLVKRLSRRDPELAKSYLAEVGPALVLLEDSKIDGFEDWLQLVNRFAAPTYKRDSNQGLLSKNSEEFLENVAKFLFGK